MKYPMDMKYACAYCGINFISFLLCKNFIIKKLFHIALQYFIKYTHFAFTQIVFAYSIDFYLRNSYNGYNQRFTARENHEKEISCHH